MTTPRIAILGAGAAGTAATKALIDSDPDLEIDLIAATGQAPFNRTLINKGIAIGLLTPEQTRLPALAVEPVDDSVEDVDLADGSVRLRSGDRRHYDALIVATGSRPQLLDPDLIPGTEQAVASGRLTTLHSPADACRVRDLIAITNRRVRIIILGAGLIGAETASLLHDAGHDVILIARAPLPGAPAFGTSVAERLAELHRTHVTCHFGHELQAIRTDHDTIGVRLDDGTHIQADLAILAHGTHPAPPAPWTIEGIGVNDRLRHTEATSAPIYAAGGIARIHDNLLGTYRIDHWDDATAQGEHAARALLHELGRGEDPQGYRPRSTYVSRIYGHTASGAGASISTGHDRDITSTPLMTVREHHDIPIAVVGLDATTGVQDWKARLFR